MKIFIRLAVLTLTLCVTGKGNVLIYKPLPLPKAEEVDLFTNGLPVETGRRVYKKKEDILEFLLHGTNVLDVLSWDGLEHPVPKAPGPFLLPGLDPCDGVFTDKSGKFYFWSLPTPGVLVLRNAQGESALIQLNHP